MSCTVAFGMYQTHPDREPERIKASGHRCAMYRIRIPYMPEAYTYVLHTIRIFPSLTPCYPIRETGNMVTPVTIQIFSLLLYEK